MPISHLLLTNTFAQEIEKINLIIDNLNNTTAYSVPHFTVTDGPLLVGTATDDTVNLCQLAGTMRVDDQAKFADGSAGAPGVTFQNEASSGLYRRASGRVGVSVLGTEVVEASSAGVAVGTNTITEKFNVNGTTYLNGAIYGSNTARDVVLTASNPGSPVYYKLASLPASIGSTYDCLNISGIIGNWGSNTKYKIDAYFGNRNVFTCAQNVFFGSDNLSSSRPRLVAYDNSDVTDIYILFPASMYSMCALDLIGSAQTTINHNPTTTSTTGTLIYDSATTTSGISQDSSGLTSVSGDPTDDLGIATKQYVDDAASGVWSTGDFKWTSNSTIPTGWLLCTSSYSVGGLSSIATYKGTTYQNLYNLLWATDLRYSNGLVLDATNKWIARGGSASADWAANKAIPLPLAEGRSLMAFGHGHTLNAVVGETFLQTSLSNTETYMGYDTYATGEYVHALTSSENGTHAHASGNGQHFAGVQFTNAGNTSVGGSHVYCDDSGENTASSGSGTAHNTVHPIYTAYLLIKY